MRSLRFFFVFLVVRTKTPKNSKEKSFMQLISLSFQYRLKAVTSVTNIYFFGYFQLNEIWENSCNSCLNKLEVISFYPPKAVQI